MVFSIQYRFIDVASEWRTFNNEKANADPYPDVGSSDPSDSSDEHGLSCISAHCKLFKKNYISLNNI